MTAAFTPTHTVPDSGAPAWERPDPSAPVIARLDPRLPVQVDERRDDWAHIACSNGFTAWVDGRSLIPIQAAGSSPASQPPPAASSPAAPKGQPASRPRRSGLGCLVRGCLTLVLLIVVVVVGTALAFSSGVVTKDGLLGLIGRGPGHVSITNFRDEIVTANLTETGSDASYSSGADLGSLGVAGLRAPEPGRYTLELTINGDPLASCSLTVRSGDEYRIALLPSTAIIHRNNDVVTSGSELVIATSSLCH